MRSATSRLFHLVAPSGYCHNQAAAQRGIERLTAAGHRVENRAVISRRFQRFAGDDSERLQDINALATLPALPDIVLAVRGGYGATRLLDQVDYTALRQLAGKPLAICGHSDFTALQLALLTQSGLITFSGPMLCGNFGAEQLSDFTVEHFWRAITQPEFRVEWQTSAPDTQVSGRLWGGNLAMIASLVGTPWLPQGDDGMLVIEDVNEHPFRTERMLLQLHQSGILARQRAIITGSFTGATLSDYDNGFDFPDVWQRIRALTGLPVITDLAFGHDQDTVTLPLGAQAVLQVNQGRSQLSIKGHPTLR
ncbi:muramoyltetrapeptide carboxypeptidase [Erwiniaceae bacterium BAC15a-03b]|uniref:Muramoyltetrapeptide carboxypeptidase n=1 Tax=Winslowiella arboricola TaxID=2978220 RepID=A0A9J6PTS3_9GAMM|nr:muramoyltetrapeptide carboxypeptidase [Winslowiella arboricola]MCU5774762.1 muramoyltetrapeptide carboxypeptidase [Winslowiella arboricola]MCU5780086.1 muramoyltetrapeptide carboxypeptidase [Winslowiella arboricola]